MNKTAFKIAESTKNKQTHLEAKKGSLRGRAQNECKRCLSCLVTQSAQSSKELSG